MTLSLDTNLQGVQGVGGVNVDRLPGVPQGFFGGPLNAAEQALGVHLHATRHDHSVTLQSALLKVHNDSVRRLLENF